MFGLPLYLHNAAPSTPIKHGSNGLAYEMHKKRRKKKEGKTERKEEKMGAKKTNKKKPISMHIHFPTVTLAACAMTFGECKILDSAWL